MVFFRTLAVVAFLDISLVWLDAVHRATIGRVLEKQRFRRIYIIVRLSELSVLLGLVIFISRLILSNGRTYNVSLSVITLLSACLVIFLFAYGRYRITTILSKPANEKLTEKEKENQKLLKIVRNFSTVIFVSNLGVIATQLYFILEVINFEDFLESNNNAVSTLLVSLLHSMTIVS